MGGGGGEWGKKSCKVKNDWKKIRAKTAQKKIVQKEKCYCGHYLMYKTCQ